MTFSVFANARQRRRKRFEMSSSRPKFRRTKRSWDTSGRCCAPSGSSRIMAWRASTPSRKITPMMRSFNSGYSSLCGGERQTQRRGSLVLFPERLEFEKKVPDFFFKSVFFVLRPLSFISFAYLRCLNTVPWTDLTNS